MKIELTETEIVHIMDALRERVNDLRESHSMSGLMEEADLANELEDLEHDLLEFSARNDDDSWEGKTFTVSENDFIDAGTHARKQQELNNRLMQGTQCTVDVWALNGLED